MEIQKDISPKIVKNGDIKSYISKNRQKWRYNLTLL